MDRIATLRTDEDARADFEADHMDFETCERRVLAAVRTFAAEFDDEFGCYRGNSGTVVVARSREEPRERLHKLTGSSSADGGTVAVTRHIY